MPFKRLNENPVTCCLLLVQGAYYSFAVNETHVNVRPQMSYKSTNLAKLRVEHKMKYRLDKVYYLLRETNEESMHCSDYLLGVCIYDETYLVIETESESTFLRRFLLPILGEIQTFLH